MSQSKHTAVAAAVFIAVVCIFFNDVLFGDRILLTCNTSEWEPWRTYASDDRLKERTYRTDSARTYLPRWVELARGLRSGRVPLWNPYVFAGTPFFADPQSRAAYPISLVLAAADPARAMGYDAAIHFFIAMFGMYLFLRTIGSSHVGSLAGAFAYGFSSFFFLRMGHPTFVSTASWIPFSFYCYERAKVAERSGTLLLTGSLCLGYLAGMPQLFLYGAAALVIYVIFDSIEAAVRREMAAAARRAKIIVVSALLSGLVVSVQLVPFAEFLKDAGGQGLSFDAVKQAHLWKPLFLIRAAVPDFFGNPIEGTSWVGVVKGVVHPYDSGFMIYCGSAALLLALASIVHVRRSPHIRVFSALLILSIGVGTSALMLKVASVLLPLATYSQIDRVSVIACFALAAMVGKGLSIVSRPGEKSARRRFFVLSLALLGCFIGGSAVFVAGGRGLISDVSVKASDLLGQGWFARSGFRLRGWLDAGGGPWWNFEVREIGRAAIFAASGLVLAILYVTYRLRRRIAFSLATLLVLVLGLDVGVIARRYYVSQPQDSLRTTEGIDLVRTVVGEAGAWRIGNVTRSESALPSNIPQIFRMPTLDGTAALYPSAHASRLGAAMASGDISPVMGLAAGKVGDIMSVRYLVAEGLLQDLITSPVLARMAADEALSASLRVRGFESDLRFCLCRPAGESRSLDILVPECEALDICVGIGVADEAEPGTPVGVTVGLSAPDREATFSQELGPSDFGKWHELRMAMPGLEGSCATLTLSSVVSEGWDGPLPEIHWGGFEFVIRDCEPRRIPEGYGISLNRLPDGPAQALRLEVAVEAEEFPLKISGDSIKSWSELRWVGPGPAGSSRRVLVDLEGPLGEVMVEADRDFTISEAKVVYSESPGNSKYRPVYTGDMCVYENQAAFPKGVCIGREVFTAEVLRLAGTWDDLARHVCGRSELHAYEPEKIVLDVHAEEDCVFLFQDTHYRGWSASVNGVRQRLHRTDVGCRALPLAAGDHRVVMRFRPLSVKLGLGLTCLGIILSIVYAKKAKTRQEA